MSDSRLVYVIDDEEAVRHSVAFFLEAHGLSVQSFASADEFLAALPTIPPGCILTDMRMPGLDGLGLLERLRSLNLAWPVVVMTAHGDVPRAVQALKAGASDFVEKPFPDNALLDAVLAALQVLDKSREDAADLAEINGRIASLTPREREVLEQLVSGHRNKVIAYNLGTSTRTVEVHRARIMDKMRARSLSALVRMAVSAGFGAGERIR